MNSVQLHSCTVASKLTKFCSKKSTSTKGGIHSSIDDVDSVHLGLSENRQGKQVSTVNCSLVNYSCFMLYFLCLLVSCRPREPQSLIRRWERSSTADISLLQLAPVRLWLVKHQIDGDLLIVNQLSMVSIVSIVFISNFSNPKKDAEKLEWKLWRKHHLEHPQFKHPK